MLIDCATCVARDIACADCVVTVLLQLAPPGRTRVDGPVEFDEAECAAIDELASAGLVPPLRLVAATEPSAHLHSMSDLPRNSKEIA